MGSHASHAASFSSFVAVLALLFHWGAPRMYCHPAAGRAAATAAGSLLALAGSAGASNGATTGRIAASVSAYKEVVVEEEALGP